MLHDERQTLEIAWINILPQLAILCRRIGGNDHRGDEIFQRASVRIIRSLAGYRGESSLMTWASTIAHHERDRLFAQEIAERRKRASFGAEAVTELEARPTADGVRLRKAEILASAVRTASNCGELSKNEASVILARIDYPAATWKDIGAMLYMTAEACAQAHCRGIVTLRVYVFTHRPDVFGGTQAIEDAFARAETDKDDPMTTAEHMAFEQVVVKRATGYSRRGWRESLRSACLKVSRKLEMDDD